MTDEPLKEGVFKTIRNWITASYLMESIFSQRAALSEEEDENEEEEGEDEEGEEEEEIRRRGTRLPTIQGLVSNCQKNFKK